MVKFGSFKNRFTGGKKTFQKQKSRQHFKKRIAVGNFKREIWNRISIPFRRNSIGKIIKRFPRPQRHWVVGHAWSKLERNLYRWMKNADATYETETLKLYTIMRSTRNWRKVSLLRWNKTNQIKNYFKIKFKVDSPIRGLAHRSSVFFNRSIWFRLKLYSKVEKIKNLVFSNYFKFWSKKKWGRTKWVKDEWQKNNVSFFKYFRVKIYPQYQKHQKWFKILKRRVMWRFRKVQKVKKRKFLIWMLNKYFYKKLKLKKKFFKKFKNFSDYNGFAENRLVQAVLRTGVIKNFKQSCRYITAGRIFVNGFCITDINYETKPNDIIFLNIGWRYWRYRNFKTNKGKSFSFNHGGFLTARKFRIFCLSDCNRNKHKKNIKKFRLISYYNYRLLSKCD